MILVGLVFRAIGKLGRAIVEDGFVIVGLKRRGSMRETWWRR